MAERILDVNQLREILDAELGRKIARQNAVSKVWPLLGFLLKEKLHGQST